MRIRLWILAVISCFVLQTSAGQQKPATIEIHSRADMAQAVDGIQVDLSTLNQHHDNYRQAAEKLSTLYASLSKKAEEVGKAASGVHSTPSNAAAVNQLLAAVQQMQETQMSFNLQYLQLQETMQNENRQYTMVSNIMKTKQDTVKNSISNIR